MSQSPGATRRARGDSVTMWEPEIEALPRERLEALQLERMRTTLARALAIPGHVRRLGGAAPGDLRRVDDWRRLPFLLKDELRDAYPYGLAGGRRADYRRLRLARSARGDPHMHPVTAGRGGQRR